MFLNMHHVCFVSLQFPNIDELQQFPSYFILYLMVGNWKIFMNGNRMRLNAFSFFFIFLTMIVKQKQIELKYILMGKFDK